MAKLIAEMNRKFQALKIPRGMNVRPVLIFDGKESEQEHYELKNYFDKLLTFSELL